MLSVVNSEMTEESLDLQRKIVKALNEEIGTDLKQLYKFKELHDETKTIRNDLKEKVKIKIICTKSCLELQVSFTYLFSSL